MSNLDKELMQAVEDHNVEVVKLCLEKGANPNYFEPVYEHVVPEFQPSTPLRMVVFRISDALLPDEGLKDFAEIAKLLLKYKADPKTAMDLAEHRYGKPRGKNLFTAVLDIIAAALPK